MDQKPFVIDRSSMCLINYEICEFGLNEMHYLNMFLIH